MSGEKASRVAPTDSPSPSPSDPASDNDFWDTVLTVEDNLHPRISDSSLGVAKGCLQTLTAYGRSALPRFLSPGRLISEEDLHSTSYLDAIRGYAAIGIMNSHYFALSDTWLFQLPLVRVVHAGPSMVNVFFVISGFVLTQSKIRHIHTRQKSRLLDSTVSSLFRRYLRLYSPCVLASFCAMCITNVGWATGRMGKRAPTAVSQIIDWSSDITRFLNPFIPLTGYHVWRDSPKSLYLPPTWTIPVEFQASIIVIVFCLATSRLSTRNRLTTGIATYILI
jgi:peptidoglycan/LPS O-acetylase OafA/YrhL